MEFTTFDFGNVHGGPDVPKEFARPGEAWSPQYVVPPVFAFYILEPRLTAERSTRIESFEVRADELFLVVRVEVCFPDETWRVCRNRAKEIKRSFIGERASAIGTLDPDRHRRAVSHDPEPRLAFTQQCICILFELIDIDHRYDSARYPLFQRCVRSNAQAVPTPILILQLLFCRAQVIHRVTQQFRQPWQSDLESEITNRASDVGSVEA